MLVKEEEMESVLRSLVEHVGDVFGQKLMKLVDDDEEFARRFAGARLLAAFAYFPELVQEQRADDLCILIAQRSGWLQIHEEHFPGFDDVLEIDAIREKAHHAPKLQRLDESKQPIAGALDLAGKFLSLLIR